MPRGSVAWTARRCGIGCTASMNGVPKGSRTAGRKATRRASRRNSWAQLAEVVETGPERAVHGVVRWRRVDLQQIVAERFGVAYHERTIGKILKKPASARSCLVRQWPRRGSRPRQPADQRYESAYLFGAICPARGTGAALAMPYADSEAMQLHLVEISSRVRRGAHAVLLLDRAGWHTTGRLVVPKNITLVFLPSRAPELNPVENIWQYLR